MCGGVCRFEDTVDALRVKLKSIEEKKAKLRTSSDRMQYKVSNAGAADSWF